MKHLSILLLLLFPLFSIAEIYQWTDENGVVHFGDAPSKKNQAEQVTVEVNSYENVSYDNVEFYQKQEAKRVIMYGTSWCGYCKKARKYFNANGIAFTEYDIEKDKRARKRYDKLGGQGIPVIFVGKQRMNGFSRSRFDAMYRQK